MKSFQNSIASSWHWEIFLFSILLLILIDIAIIHKSKTIENLKTALANSFFWISIALLFNVYIFFNFGSKAGIEFFTGYLIEKSLSLDNVFVIYLIFDSLRVPINYQRYGLYWGVIGAIFFRGIFIFIGLELVYRFHWILYIFGIILIYSAVQFIRTKEDSVSYTDHIAIRWLKKIIPIQEKMVDGNLFVRVEGKIFVTPLFVALILIEFSDIVFAVDSVPAIFAITKDPFIAFSSNILAILGLRSLYFVIAHTIQKIIYLKAGLSVILGYVGLKMLLVDIFTIPSWVSLLVISAILSTAALSSWYVHYIKNKNFQ